MPVSIEKADGGYRVSTPHGTKAKHTTLAKALAQKRLLNAVEHSDWRPTGNPSPDQTRRAAKIAKAKLKSREK